MKSQLKVFAPLVFFLLTCSSETVADPVVTDPVWKLTATNNTGMVVFGFQLIFTGTGGTITNPIVIMNAPGAGNANVAVISSGSGVGVTWGQPGLPVGGSFMIQFSTNFSPIMPAGGFWLVPEEKAIDLNRDNVTVQEIPEPVTLLLLATGLAGVAINSRKKLKGNGG